MPETWHWAGPELEKTQMNTILKTTLAAATLAVGLAGAAAAQDATQWNGFYGGLQFDITSPELDGTPTQVGTGHGGTAFVGYNHAIDQNWVVGGELSFGRQSGMEAGPNELIIENAVHLRGRAGYNVGNTLLYGSLGYMTADFNGGGPDISGDGMTFGLGAETMITDRVSARIEFTRSDMDLEEIGRAHV